VISIADDGKQTWLQAAGRDPRPLGDLSPELLLAAIRDGVVADGGPACA
jgi:hypothetical protein